MGIHRNIGVKKLSQSAAKYTTNTVHPLTSQDPEMLLELAPAIPLEN